MTSVTSDFSIFSNRYFVTADLILERPLHIGKGASLEPIGTDLPVIKDFQGNPYIPGSSVKGVLRTEFERVLRTFDTNKIVLDAPQERLYACEPFDEPCITKECIEKLKENKKDYEITQSILENSCTACKFFGSPWIASKIYFKDMFLKNRQDMFRVSEIRDGVGIDRDTGTAKKGVKFDYEIVPTGACFGFEAILENVDTWNVALFLLILRLWERGEIAIGGKTSRGLGWGRLENLRVEKVEDAGLLDYLLEGKKTEIRIEKLIEELRNKLKKEEEDA